MRRIPSLDGLRAISIPLVVLSHLVQWNHISLELVRGYGALGCAALSFCLVEQPMLRLREKLLRAPVRPASPELERTPESEVKGTPQNAEATAGT